MAIIDNKITDSDLSSYGVVSAPDRLTGTANQNKQVFDRLIKQAVKVKINELIDDLLAASAAGQLGASPPSGLSGSTVQAVLQSLKSYVDSTKVAKEPGKGLSQNDYTDADKALVGQIPDKADKTYVDQNMVAQIPGKGLSSNDYTDAEKELVAQIPHKAGTDNVLTKDNTAPFEPTGDYNPCTKKYADDLAFSAGAVTSVFGRAGAVVAQDGDYTPQQVGAEPAFSVLPQSKGGTGQSSLADVTEFSKAFSWISNGSLLDWADSQQVSSLVFATTPATDLPEEPGYFSGFFIKHNASLESSLVLVSLPGSANQLKAKIFLNTKEGDGEWKGWSETNAKYAAGLLSPDGTKTANLADNGGITFPGVVVAKGFTQSKEYYAQPNEIGKCLDFHRTDSVSDYDARIGVNESPTYYLYIQNPMKKVQEGGIVTSVSGNVLSLVVTTQSSYNSLPSKDPQTLYLIVG